MYKYSLRIRRRVPGRKLESVDYERQKTGMGIWQKDEGAEKSEKAHFFLPALSFGNFRWNSLEKFPHISAYFRLFPHLPDFKGYLKRRNWQRNVWQRNNQCKNLKMNDLQNHQPSSGLARHSRGGEGGTRSGKVGQTC